MAQGAKDGIGGGAEARLARVERLLEAVALTQRDIMDRLDVQQEKLNALIAAVEREPKPGPIEAVLRDVLAETRKQTALMLAMGGTAEAPDA